MREFKLCQATLWGREGLELTKIGFFGY